MHYNRSFTRILFIVILLHLFPAVTHAVPKAPQSFWQLTLQNKKDGIQLLNAHPLSSTIKELSQPGKLLAIQGVVAQFTWYRDSTIVYTTNGEIPFGDRFGEACAGQGRCDIPNNALSVIRLRGPARNSGATLLQIDLLEEKSYLSIPIDDSLLSTNVTRTLRLDLHRTLRDIADPSEGPISVSTVLKTGDDSNRFVIAILGDGYRTEDIDSGKYLLDVANLVTALQNTSPWNKLLLTSNIYLINVVSRETGADDPAASVSADTYFGSSFGSYGIQRLLVPDNAGKVKAFEAADNFIGVGFWDAILMLVNDSQYGGSGGVIATASTHQDSAEILIHEMGHSIAGLADEYNYSATTTSFNLSAPNLDSNGRKPKWSLWLTPNIPLPTPDYSRYRSVVGAFDMGSSATKAYRPVMSCKMQYLNSPFCPVCREAITKSVLDQVKLYDFATANTEVIQLTTSVTPFTVQVIQGFPVKTSWRLCGKSVRAKKDTILLSKRSLKNKSCRLIATVGLKTPLIRKGAVTSKIEWELR